VVRLELLIKFARRVHECDPRRKSVREFAEKGC
jgi:hypothetical protein